MDEIGELTFAAFAEIAHSLATAPDAPEVMVRVAERAVRHTRSKGAYVERVISPEGMVEVVTGVGDGLPTAGTRVPYPGSLTEEMIEHGDPTLMAEVGQLGAAIAPYLAKECDGCSALLVPLVSMGEVLGTLVLLGEPGIRLNDGEVAFARALGDLASVSMRRVLVLEESESRRRELRISEQRFRLLVESVSDYAIIMLDPEGRVVSWTDAAQKITGYPSEEIIGRHYSVFHDPDRPQPEIRVELEVAGEKGRFESEGWRVRRDGSRYWAHVTTSAIRDSEGNLTGFSKIARDLTDRRISEVALRESEQRFRALAENATEAIITIDLQDRIHFSNPAVTEIFGYSGEELSEMSFAALMPERMRDRHLEGLKRFAATRTRNIPWDGIELPGRHRDGHEIPLEVTFSFYEHHGEIFFSGIMRDITARKDAEVEQQRLLREEQAAREQAEAAVEARERVLGIVSHDLRNPLNTILMSVGFLSDELFEDAKPEAREKQLRIIQRSSERMNRMIQDLLDISRIESGTLSVNAEPLSADLLAQEACELIQPLMIDKSQIFACDLTDPLPTVKADRDRIHQVISNLAGNAVKFTPEDGRVELRVRQVDAYVEFGVIDTGSGIARDDIPRLFDAHWQAAKTAHLGAGLGLAIARGIVEAHDGRIWVESTDGEGSAFFFTLPIYEGRGADIFAA